VRFLGSQKSSSDEDECSDEGDSDGQLAADSRIDGLDCDLRKLGGHKKLGVRGGLHSPAERPEGADRWRSSGVMVPLQALSSSDHWLSWGVNMPPLMGGLLALLATESVGVGGMKKMSALASSGSIVGELGVSIPFDFLKASSEKDCEPSIGVGTCSVGVDLTWIWAFWLIRLEGKGMDDSMPEATGVELC